MTTTESVCVGCPDEMGCLGNACPHRTVTRGYCDVCGRPLEWYDRTRWQGADDVLYISELDDERCLDCCMELYLKPEETSEETICEGCGEECFTEDTRDVWGKRLCRDCIAKRLRKAVAPVWE